MFFELCDENNEGYINEEKMLRFLKQNLKSNTEKSLIKDASMTYKLINDNNIPLFKFYISF